jgi:actin-like ATPase involved in cell morphogenesis
MSEETNVEIKSPICIGLDVGTMNLVCTRSDTNETKITRNVFLPVSKDEIGMSDLSELSHIENEDGELFIIGEDAFKFSNIFGQEVRRPMKRGVISSDEIDAVEILTLIIKDLIGDLNGQQAYCTYSIPAEALDSDKSITYHEKIFGRILSSLGINAVPLNEAMAIIYSECQSTGFTGIGISAGAGMVNCVTSVKGINVIEFSTEQSGDWIDKNVADSLNMVRNRVTNIKEKYLSLNKDFREHKNKKIRRVLEALGYYYNAMVSNTVSRILKEFEAKVDLDLDEEIPIVISGGTSLPDGFVELFQSEMDKYDIPFEVSEVKRSKVPLNTVSNGLLIKALASVPK